MVTLQIEIISYSEDHLTFKLIMTKQIIYYLLFTVITLTSFTLFIIRFLFDPTITMIGFLISIVALILFIIGIYLLRSLTTEFYINFNYSSLKLSIIKNQIYIFSRNFERSYTGMMLESAINPPSYINWSRFFLVKGQTFFLPKSHIIANNYSLDWKAFQNEILRVFLLSKRLPKPDQELILSE